MKGIILAGGTGSRLHPITLGISKQLMPIYNKPMIYYPLSTLMLAGIDEVLIITTPEDKESFQNLLGDGSEIGMKLSYTVQESPDGLAQAFIIAEEFIGDDSVALVLGDNIFHGAELADSLLGAAQTKNGATVFAYSVSDPERYGVVEFDEQGKAISVEEKPSDPKSNYAVVGIYFYDNRVIEIAKSIKPSPRGELEITDVNDVYLKEGSLKVKVMSRGDAWLDTGTFTSMMDASNYVEVIERRTGLMIGCIEEVAYKRGLIDSAQLDKLALKYKKSGYGEYLAGLDK